MKAYRSFAHLRRQAQKNSSRGLGMTDEEVQEKLQEFRRSAQEADQRRRQSSILGPHRLMLPR